MVRRVRSSGPHADHRHVNPEAAKVLRALLDSRDGVTTRTIANATGLDAAATDDLLAALAVVGIVEPTAPGRWRPHLTIRQHHGHQVVDGLLTLLAGQQLPDPQAQEQAQPPPPRPAPPAPPPPKPQPPLPLGAAAKELRVSWYTLRDWARLGRVPYVWTPGGQRRFDVEEIRRLMKNRPERSPRTVKAA